MAFAAERRSIPRRARGALGIAISAVSLGAAIWWASRQDAPSFPSSASALTLLTLALAVYAVVTLIRGWRWHSVMLLSGVDHRPIDAYALTVVGYMGNIVLPARGGELLRVLLLGERSSSPRRAIFGTIVAERLLDAAVLVALFVLMTWSQVAGAPVGQGPAAVAALALGVAVASAGLYLRARRRGRFERFADLVRPFVRPTKLLFGKRGVVLALATTVVWLLEGVIFLLIGRALDIELDLVGATFVVVLASFFALAPAAPGYVGTYDAGVLLGLKALDVAGGDAVTFALLVRFVNFVPVALVGLFLLLISYGGIRRLRVPTRDDVEPSIGEPASPVVMHYPPPYAEFLAFERRVFGEPPPITTYDPYLIRYGEYRFILGLLPLEHGVKVVDIGCETNLLMFFLSIRGADVLGIDIDPELAAVVEERKQLVQRATGVEPSLTFEVQDATDLSIEPASADIAIATSSIEHMFSDRGNGDELAVDGIARALRPGGVAAITVPMSNGAPFHESRLGDERFAGPYRLYTPEVLAERFLSHPDLETVRLNYLAHSMPAPGYADTEFHRFWVDELDSEDREKWAWANPIFSAVFNPIVGSDSAGEREAALNTALIFLRKNG